MFFTAIVSFLFLLYIYCFINMSLLQAYNGMRVSPGCLFNTLSTQGLLLTVGWTIPCGWGSLGDLKVNSKGTRQVRGLVSLTRVLCNHPMAWG